MFWIVLLLIVAILLFGLSTILGATGIVLGFISAAGALAVASVMFEMGAGEIMILGVLGFVAIVGVIVAINAVTQS